MSSYFAILLQSAVKPQSRIFALGINVKDKNSFGVNGGKSNRFFLNGCAIYDFISANDNINYNSSNSLFSQSNRSL